MRAGALAVALAVSLSLSSLSVADGATKTERAFGIAQAFWVEHELAVERYCPDGVRVRRARIPFTAYADLVQCEIVFDAPGYMPWDEFCATMTHELGHLSRWQAWEGDQFRFYDAQGRLYDDYWHSRRPRSVMHRFAPWPPPVCRSS